MLRPRLSPTVGRAVIGILPAAHARRRNSGRPTPHHAKRPSNRRLNTSVSGECSSGEAGGGGGGGGGTAEDAFEAAQQVIALFACGNKDALIDFMPEAVIDQCMDRRREAGAAGSIADLTFDDVLTFARPADFELDAFAQRALILHPPAATCPLSTLRLGPDRALQRYDVVAASGEEMVITLRMVLEEALQPRYRSVQFVHRWCLAAATGEPAAAEPPAEPAPQHGPESVVQAQLEALRREDARGVFAFASPGNQAAFGGDVKLFEQMLGTDGYRPLLGHRSAAVLRSTQVDAETALVLVGLVPRAGAKAVFSWVVQLQGEAAGDGAGCWMTEGVTPVSQGSLGAL